VSSRISDALVTTGELSEVFGDASAIQTMLDVEAALARAQSSLGLVPREAALAITKAATAAAFDSAALVRDAREHGTLAIPLVKALTERVRTVDPSAAGFVHWGATSQDIVDTALVLLIDRATDLIGRDHAHFAASLRALSDRHKDEVMLGRTLLQPAAPITFGLKVAGWYAAVQRGWARVDTRRREAVVLQFGGAAGTLAALGANGMHVAERLGRELGLRCPDASWHAYHDNIAALVAACGIYAGSLGKVARDISLLMQFEVGEARETGGGSSAMPQKQNPSGCAVALAAASRLPGLTATAISLLVQEHERSVGSWLTTWPTVADALQATGAAAAAMRAVMAGLIVDAARMRSNLEATNGAVYAERVMMLAARTLGREQAHRLVKDALAARPRGQSLSAAVRATPALASAISDSDLESLDDPRAYLGSAEMLRQRLLAGSN
jgi:3-carboxy-cis,cis-muconate cycloisomerase